MNNFLYVNRARPVPGATRENPYENVRFKRTDWGLIRACAWNSSVHVPARPSVDANIAGICSDAPMRLVFFVDRALRVVNPV
jgi:hypothetical protein